MFCSLLLNSCPDDLTDICISLVRDDAFGIIIEFPFAVIYMLLKMCSEHRIQLKLLHDPAVSFKYLDCIPAEILPAYFSLN